MNYALLILIPTLLYMVEDLAKTKGNYFRKLGIAFIIVFVSLRYNFGADYLTYRDAFYRLKSGDRSDQFEFGYIALNDLIGWLGLDFNFVLLVIAIFNYTLLYLTIERSEQKYKWMSIFLFLVYFDLFFYSLSAVRQSIVISIFLYSAKYIVDKQFIKYFAWIAFGSIFHWTSVALLPVYFLYNFLRNKSSYTLVAVFFLISALYYLLINNIVLLTAYVNPKLYYYLFIEEMEIVSAGSNALIYGAGGLLVIYLSAVIGQKANKQTEGLGIPIGMTFPFFAMMMYFSLKVMQSIQYYSILPRMQMYYYGFYILVLPQILKMVDAKIRPLLIMFVCGFMLFLFYLKYNDINTYARDYYEYFRLIL